MTYETETDDDVIVIPIEQNQTLSLECYDEELNEAQKTAYDNALKEHNDIKDKLKEIIGATGGQSIFSGELFSAYEILGPAPGIENISKPISSFNKKEPKRDKQKKREYESEEEDDIPLSKRKAKDKKKDKKHKCRVISLIK